MDVYRSDFSVELKQDQSPLTVADRRSHEILSSYLHEHYPFPVLSEEGKDIPYEERRNWERFWLVDPLDGTKEFIKRNGEFTVNVALMQGCTPIAGIIYVPAKDVLYYAAKGQGAYKRENDVIVKLPLAGAERPARFTIVGSRSHRSVDFDDYVRTLEEKHGKVELISAGSSLKFCLVAEGRAHVYPRLGPTMEWDTAAGQAIVEEAGGSVREAGSDRLLSYNKMNLLNPHFVAMNIPFSPNA